MNKKIFVWLTILLWIGCCLLSACGTHTHDWTMKSNAQEHWQVCEEDGEEKPFSRQPHADGNSDGVCDGCGYIITSKPDDKTPDDGEPDDGEPDDGSSDDDHSHKFEVRYDSDGHWTECLCGLTTEKSQHDFDNKGKCSVCGYTQQQQDCDHNYVTLRDADGHWQQCSVCGDKQTKTNHQQQQNYLCSCGYAFDAPAAGGLSSLNFWIVGTFTDDNGSTQGWGETHNDKWKFHRLAQAVDGNTVYVFEREMSGGEEFKIVNDGGDGYWNGELNASNLTTEARRYLDGNGGGNIRVTGAKGYYRITVSYGNDAKIDCTLVYASGQVPQL